RPGGYIGNAVTSVSTQRAENGEIRKKLDSAAVSVYLQGANALSIAVLLWRSGDLYTTANEADQKLSSRERRSEVLNAATDLKKDRLGTKYLKLGWSRVKRELIETGQTSKPTWEWLISTVGVSDYPERNGLSPASRMQ